MACHIYPSIIPVSYTHLAYSLLGDIYFRVYKEKIYFFLGSGVSYLSKHYTEDNYRNFAIGSHFNVHINFGWDFIIYQKSPLLINMQFRWNHFSNGAIKMPNTGLNIPSLHLSLIHIYVTIRIRRLSQPSSLFKSVFIFASLK